MATPQQNSKATSVRQRGIGGTWRAGDGGFILPSEDISPLPHESPESRGAEENWQISSV